MKAPPFASSSVLRAATAGWRCGRTVVVFIVVAALHAGAVWALVLASRQQPATAPAPLAVALLPASTTVQAASAAPNPAATASSSPAPRLRIAPQANPSSALPADDRAPGPARVEATAVSLAGSDASPAGATADGEPGPPATAAGAAEGDVTALASTATAALAAPPVAADVGPPSVEPPSASAAYLHNPPPDYPALSRRLGEQGRVVLRVRIEPDGTASAAEVRTSSGYERLDKAALEAVLRWRYVPGKRDGVPEAMWFLVPIQFVLE